MSDERSELIGGRSRCEPVVMAEADVWSVGRPAGGLAGVTRMRILNESEEDECE